MPKDDTRSLGVDADLYDALRIHALWRGTSMKAVGDEAIREYFERHPLNIGKHITRIGRHEKRYDK